MNKIIASTGLVALSAAGLQAAYAPGVSAQDSAKSWSLHGGVQGFYDSNSTTSPDATRQESWGVGFDVGAGYNLPLDQTFFGVDATYGLKWYEARDNGNTDQSFIFNLKLDHAFSEQYDVSVKDSFVYSDEPTVLDAGSPVSSPLRTDSNSFRNRGNVDFGMQFTPKWGMGVGLENTYYHYTQGAGDVVNSVTGPSREQLLDRTASMVPIDVRYTVNPKLIGLLGYQYGRTDYLSDDSYLTPYSTSAANVFSPDWRNSQAHFGYVGAEYSVSSQLNTAIKAGVQYTTYDNLKDNATTSSWDDSNVTPYVDLSVSYLYNPGSYITGGYTYGLTATDVQVLDNKSSVVYVALTHRITSRVDANLLYQFQYSSYNNNDNTPGFGGLGDPGESFNIVGIDFSYKISKYLSAQVGYKFDDLNSDLPNRSYNRHVGFVGLRAHY